MGGGGGQKRKKQHMLMEACAESGGAATLRAHSGSAERSLERIGDEGASQAGETLSLSLSLCHFPSLSLCLTSPLSLASSGCLGAEVVVSR